MSTIETRQEPGHGGGVDRSPGIWAVTRGLLLETRFLITVVVLCVAAIGLNASVQLLQLHFKKDPVAMRKPFSDPHVMPDVVGQWVLAARQETISKEMQDALGTEEFFFSSYINAEALGKTVEQLKSEFDKKPYADQQREVLILQGQFPTAVLSVALTYYTGKADTVAHIPERCYIGDGFDVLTPPQTEQWGLGRNLPVRFITFAKASALSGVDCNVAYFFHTNGRYESDSLAVRAMLQNLFARYGYYAKVELMTVSKDRAGSQKAMRDFLTAALPSIEAALPDWSSYQARK